MRTSLAPQVIGRCRSRAIRSLSGLRLVVDRLVATKARTAPPQVASERVAAGRNFLWNHNHARDVRWVGRSSLPTDFPDPDRPCERNPGPPTGVSLAAESLEACERGWLWPPAPGPAPIAWERRSCIWHMPCGAGTDRRSRKCKGHGRDRKSAMARRKPLSHSGRRSDQPEPRPYAGCAGSIRRAGQNPSAWSASRQHSAASMPATGAQARPAARTASAVPWRCRAETRSSRVPGGL
jgi:hypothetical protein